MKVEEKKMNSSNSGTERTDLLKKNDELVNMDEKPSEFNRSP